MSRPTFRSVCVVLMFSITLPVAGCAGSREPAPHDSTHASSASVPAGAALQRLIDGNARFVAGRLEHPNLSAERRSETRQGQKPFAIILGCSDSRVPADLVFDTGLGDLFVVRVAGNVTDDVVIGSIEYAVEHLGSRLILVLGHEKCGAVAAAMAAAETDEHVPGHIDSLVEAIDPALREMPASTRDRLDDAVRANVRYVTDQLRHAHPILSHAVKSGELQIVGAYYDLESGRVEVIDPSR